MLYIRGVGKVHTIALMIAKHKTPTIAYPISIEAGPEFASVGPLPQSAKAFARIHLFSRLDE